MELIDYFDHIFILHHLPKASRLVEMKCQLKHLNLDSSSDVSWEMTNDDVFSRCLYENYKNKFYTLTFGQFNCAYGHYKIISDSLLLGYDRILILEDDVAFLKDINLIQTYLDNIPKDADIVMFDYNILSGHKQTSSPLADNPYYIINDVPCGSNGCYMVTKKYMEYYIDKQSKCFRVADLLLNKIDNKDIWKRYRSSIPLTIQTLDSLSMGHSIGYNDAVIDYYKSININLDDYLL